MFNSGISKESDMLDIGAELNILQKNGSFYSFDDIKLGQGKENARIFLSENVEVSSQIQKLISESIA
jgi:recombination protein RecA